MTCVVFARGEGRLGFDGDSVLMHIIMIEGAGSR